MLAVFQFMVNLHLIREQSVISKILRMRYMSYATYSIILYCRGWLSCHINRNTCSSTIIIDGAGSTRIGYRLSISWVFWYQTNPSYQCLCTLQRICHCWYYLRGADRLDGQSSSQPHEPGYGSVYKELGANESIGLERNHWFWMVAGCGRVWDGSDDGWPSSSCSTNISCSFGCKNCFGLRKDDKFPPGNP
jgi:hypothetical protein